ncbi:MAG TPA: archaeosortase A, partial [Methanoculleus sp.]|nr:archaeosortase A [Methanoculleus sp.]
MEALLVIISCVAFFAFLLPHAYRKYCAMLGWTSIIAVLFLQIPSFLSENNFFYPSIALLSVPFLAITARLLWQENEAVFQLSRAAAVAFLVYAPFGFFEP